MNVNGEVKPEECCGCELCNSVCPFSAIELKEDKEGFVGPVVDRSICRDCSLCVKYCPVYNGNKCKSGSDNEVLETYGAYHSNEEVLLNSSSGGMASALMQYAIENGYIVVGVEYDDDFRGAHYSIVYNTDEMTKIIGTKYIQSRKNNIYKIVKEKLDNGEKILFIGLPCEVSAINQYVSGLRENLILVELICHGATSPLIAKQYLDKIEEKYKDRVVYCNVRYKKFGWTPPCLKVVFSNGIVKEKLFDSTEYGYAFRKMSRKSCYNCIFKGNNSLADITIGDFWGADQSSVIWNSKGVSVVLIRTNKGRLLFEKLRNIKKEKITYEEALKNNPCIVFPRKDIGREEYVKLLEKGDICKARKKSEKINRVIITHLRNIYYFVFKNPF